MVGIGGDLPVNERFTLTGSIMYEEASGTSDMTSQQNFGNPLPLSNYPNTKITSLNIKGRYAINKNWSVTGGYAYQKYSYSDDQFNGYTNTIPFPGVTNNTSQSYLNGWNANIPYNANIFYLTATYQFDAPPLPAPKVAEAPPPVVRPAPPPPAAATTATATAGTGKSRSTRTCCSNSTRRY
jgi:hypothetical protein